MDILLPSYARWLKYAPPGLSTTLRELKIEFHDVRFIHKLNQLVGLESLYLSLFFETWECTRPSVFILPRLVHFSLNYETTLSCNSGIATCLGGSTFAPGCTLRLDIGTITLPDAVLLEPLFQRNSVGDFVIDNNFELSRAAAKHLYPILVTIPRLRIRRIRPSLHLLRQHTIPSALTIEWPTWFRNQDREHFKRFLRELRRWSTPLAKQRVITFHIRRWNIQGGDTLSARPSASWTTWTPGGWKHNVDRRQHWMSQQGQIDEPVAPLDVHILWDDTLFASRPRPLLR
jgi:hypothetical protein